jgi:hypothetical protein
MQIALKFKGQQIGVKLETFPSMILFILAVGSAIGACFIAIGIVFVLLAALCIVLGVSLLALVVALCAASFVLWLIFVGLKRILKLVLRFITVVVLQNPPTPPTSQATGAKENDQHTGQTSHGSSTPIDEENIQDTTATPA